METYAFVHFGPNTFTDREWGEGREDPKVFAPTSLDCDQWVRAFKEAGFKMVILTAKHHDGFCLWPSKQSTHTVAASSYSGDVVAEVAKAAKKHGLKLGIYLSPWDRNHPNYGTDSYNDTFVKCLEEVLSSYGPIHEVWFDGANGEGPNGKKQVYDWPRFHETVRRLQPQACMFSDAGPDVRWVGNESGFSAETCWAMVPSNRYVPGTPYSSELTEGNENGDLYIPAECDVSIRPGWFYHASQDDKVKTVSQLVDLYFRSVGQNANFLLNVPPDRRGLVHETDVQRLRGFGTWIKRTFGRDLAQGAKAESGASRGAPFDAAKVVDGKEGTYWAAPDGKLEGDVTLHFKRRAFDVVMLQEFVELGQRVKEFGIEAEVEGRWIPIAGGTTIGYKRLLRLPETVEATGLRVSILDARACPTLRRVGLFASPDMLKREIQGRVKADQDARNRVDWKSPNMADVHAMEAIDLGNYEYLRKLIDKEGWIGSSLIGDDGAHGLWLLVQHMDLAPDFQEKCLGLMEKAVAQGEASGQDFAYLTDRVLRARKKPQRFGTQLAMNRRGELEVQECEDFAHVDERRAALGLEPIAVYLAFAKRVYDPATKDLAELLLQGWREVVVDQAGAFDLTAKLAKVVGKKAAYEEETDAIGFWTDPADEIGWLVEIPKRGEYDLKAEFACDPPAAGSTVVVRVGVAELSFRVTPTKSWRDFAVTEIGTLSLDPGFVRVVVKASDMPGGAVMNLRRILMLPHR